MNYLKLLRKTSKTVTVFALLGIFFSCSKDFLEKPVDNRVFINNLDDIQYAVGGISPVPDHLFTDMMTDDYTFKNIAGHVSSSAPIWLLPLYTFQITKESLPILPFNERGFNPSVTWIRYYFRVNNAWLLLKKINDYQPQNNEERQRLASVKGECLAIKAYCNFMLVNLFAKSYDPATSISDMAPPFVDSYSAKSITLFPQRSVAVYYDAIEKDLLEALTLVNTDFIQNPKLHFSPIAIKAFLGRLYLYKKDYNNVIKYTNEVILENSSLLKVTDIVTKHSQPYEDKESYSKDYFNPEQDAYLMVSDKAFQAMSSVYMGLYIDPVINFMKLNNYGSLDTWHFIQSSPIFSDMTPAKYRYFRDGTSEAMLPLFTVDEAYYNRAEAYLQKDPPDLEAAKNDLEALIRTDDYKDQQTKVTEMRTLTTKEALLEFFMNAKRIRFFCEGFRWFDIKRYRLPVSHVSGASTFTINGSDPEQYVIKPPAEEIDFRTYKQ